MLSINLNINPVKIVSDLIRKGDPRLWQVLQHVLSFESKIVLGCRAWVRDEQAAAGYGPNLAACIENADPLFVPSCANLIASKAVDFVHVANLQRSIWQRIQAAGDGWSKNINVATFNREQADVFSGFVFEVVAGEIMSFAVDHFMENAPTKRARKVAEDIARHRIMLIEGLDSEEARRAIQAILADIRQGYRTHAMCGVCLDLAVQLSQAQLTSGFHAKRIIRDAVEDTYRKISVCNRSGLPDDLVELIGARAFRFAALLRITNRLSAA